MTTFEAPDYETVTLFYILDENYFVDERGFVLYDIFRILTPDQLIIFKKNHKPIYIPDAECGLIYEFVYEG